MSIEVHGDALDIRVLGIHKIWALKSSLRVPLAHVREVRHDPERAKRAIPGLRLPGTHLPFVYTAGTYYQSDRRPDFWSVRNRKKAIVIQCVDSAQYDEIIVEVKDPATTVELIRAALSRGS